MFLEISFLSSVSNPSRYLHSFKGNSEDGAFESSALAAGDSVSLQIPGNLIAAIEQAQCEFASLV